MLWIIVEIVPGGIGRPREVARAQLGNISDLGKISDYEIEAREGANAVTWAKAWESRGMILGHDREQSVWVLVAKAAAWAAAEAEKQSGERLRLVAGPEAFPESVAERIRQIAEAGRRVAVEAGDLTEEEAAALGTLTEKEMAALDRKADEERGCCKSITAAAESLYGHPISANLYGRFDGQKIDFPQRKSIFRNVGGLA